MLASAALRPVDGAFQLKIDPAPVTRSNLSEPAATSDLLRLLRKVTCPTLLVRGAASALLSENAAKFMLAQLHDSEVVTIARAGHGVMADNPEAFDAALLRFVTAQLAVDACF